MQRGASRGGPRGQQEGVVVEDSALGPDFFDVDFSGSGLFAHAQDPGGEAESLHGYGEEHAGAQVGGQAASSDEMMPQDHDGHDDDARFDAELGLHELGQLSDAMDTFFDPEMGDLADDGSSADEIAQTLMGSDITSVAALTV